MNLRPVVAAALAAAAAALVACEGAMPAVRTTPTPRVGTPTEQPPSRTASPAEARPSPVPSALEDLGHEIDIHVLDPEHARHMGSFASDGRSVLFSSAAATDVPPGAGAPDLWRVEPGAEPELVWTNPERDHTLAMIRGDLGTYAFVDVPMTGERAWTLYLLPRGEDEAIVLDEHPGDEDVPSFVPSMSLYEDRVVWTSFDRGPDGPVSRLFLATGPTWEPTVLLEYPAREVEVWLPSLLGSELAYTEVRYSEDRSSDERSVWLMTIDDPEGRRRLDTTGRATMPILLPDAVLWKQAQRGYNMFNWGHVYRYDRETAEVELVDLTPQTFVNYPSAGPRFVAWYGADSFRFGVYDHVNRTARVIENNPTSSDTSVLRPHLHESLLVWLRVVGAGQDGRELRFAFLPPPKDVVLP